MDPQQVFSSKHSKTFRIVKFQNTYGKLSQKVFHENFQVFNFFCLKDLERFFMIGGCW